MSTQQTTFAAFSIPGQKSKSVDIKSIILKYLFHWPLFIIGLTFATSGLLVYLRVTKPIYEVRASLIINDKKKTPNEQSPLHEIDLLNTARIIENELEILKSKQLIGQVIDDLQLGIIYQKIDGFSSENLYKSGPVKFTLIDATGNFERGIVNLTIKDKRSFFISMPDGQLKEFFFKDTFKNSFGTWKLKVEGDIDKYRGSTIKISIFDPGILSIYYQKLISAILSNKLSTTVVLSIDDEVPQRGKDILNRLIFNYSSVGIAEKYKETKSTRDFIDKRLDSLSRELNEVEKGIETFKSSRGLTDISEDSKISLQNMQANDVRLNEVNVQLSVIEGIEKYINSSQNLGKAPATIGVEDIGLSSLIEKLSQLQLQREKLLATTPETNPDFEPINRQITVTKAAIKENVVNIKSSLKNTQEKLQTFNNRFELSIKNIPTQERQYISIKRQQSIKESLYTYLLQKREEMAVSYANTLADDSIVDEAYAGPAKGTMKSLAFAVAFLLGLGLPAGLIFLRTILSERITDIQDIKNSIEIPVIGELPFQLTQSPIVVNEFSTSLIGEQFRALRIKLYYLFGLKENGRVTLVTSSVPGEGKSFVSSNLAVTLAYSGRKTIILELDMRKPKIKQVFNLQNAHAGISDFLNNNSNLNDIIQSSGVASNLDVVISGAIVQNPSELLERKELKNLIESLRNLYDDIIIDSPPVHLVPDAMILSPLADVTLFIIRQGFTEKSELIFLKELQSQKRFTNINIIFNGIQRLKYGYGYKYDTSYYNKRKNGFDSIFSDFSSRF